MHDGGDSGLTPGKPPQPVVLEGRLVRVRPLVVGEDAARLFAAMPRAELERLYRYLPVEAPLNLEVFLTQQEAWQRVPATLQFLFEEKASGQVFGTSSYMRIVPEHRVLEVGYVLLAPRAQRTTEATEAQYLLARHAFETLRYRRYEWKCDDQNAPSRAAALRLGFRFEGVFRNHMIVKGRSRDTAWFSITDEEWPSVRQALESWLAPENFDEQGCQRARLAAFRQAGP